MKSIKKLFVAFFVISVFASVNSLADDINLWKKSTLNQIYKEGNYKFV